MKSVSELYREHVEFLERMAEAGCETSTKSLACLSLLAEGWRYGDPDPVDDGPDDDGGQPLEPGARVVVSLMLRRAA